MKIFDFLIKTFGKDNLYQEMLNSDDGQVFILGENRIKNHEGDDTVEVIMAKIIRTKSN